MLIKLQSCFVWLHLIVQWLFNGGRSVFFARMLQRVNNTAVRWVSCTSIIGLILSQGALHCIVIYSIQTSASDIYDVIKCTTEMELDFVIANAHMDGNHGNWLSFMHFNYENETNIFTLKRRFFMESRFIEFLLNNMQSICNEIYCYIFNLLQYGSI